MDFLKKLKEELNEDQADNAQGSFTTGPTRRDNQLKTINSHNPVLYARILPLGEDKWFAKPFETVFVDYTKRSGETIQVPVIIDSKDPNDVLAKLVHRVIHINYENRQNSGNDQAKDVVTLNTKNTNYRFSIKRQAEIIGIPIVKFQDGHWGMAQKADGTYYIKNYIIPWSAYQSVLSIMADDTQTLQNGKPFDSPAGLGFLTTKDTFPLEIKYDSLQRKYLTGLRGQLQLPSINYDYLVKDSTGNYQYFDDPDIFDAPLLKTDPDYYKLVLNQLVKKFKAQTNKTKSQGNNQNPYDRITKGTVSADNVNSTVPFITNSQPAKSVTKPQAFNKAKASQPQEQADPFESNKVPNASDVPGVPDMSKARDTQNNSDSKVDNNTNTIDSNNQDTPNSNAVNSTNDGLDDDFDIDGLDIDNLNFDDFK